MAAGPAAERCIGDDLLDKLDTIGFFRDVTNLLDEYKGLTNNMRICYFLTNSFPDLPSDAQVVENDYIIEFSHPSLGPIKLTGFPVSFSKTPFSVRREAPLYGQHTEEVLQEILGLGWEEISQLKKEGVC